MSTESKSSNTSLFTLDGNPSLQVALPLSLQHFVAMVVGNVLPAIVLSGALGLSPQESVILVQASMFVAALATFLQSYPIFNIGAKLPLVMGVGFAFIPTFLSIGIKEGIGAILGCQLIGGMVAFIVGLFIKKIRKYFPPIVTGTVIFTVGLSLYRVALNYMAGGFQPADPRYGGLVYWGIALLTLIVVLACNMFGKGIVKLSSILIGIIVGYLASLAAGIVSFDSITQAQWITLPKILPFKLEFPVAGIVAISIMFIVNLVQDVGQISGTTVGGMDREATEEEISGGVKVNGVVSMLGALIGALPTSSYGQNVGIVAITKVISLKVMRITAAIILLAGLTPKFAGMMTSIPQCVIGGATVLVFAQITMTGIKLITLDEMSVRNNTIVGLGVALGIGITQIPEQGLQYFPEWFTMVFASSPVVLAAIVVFILNIMLPKKTLAEEKAEREK